MENTHEHAGDESLLTAVVKWTAVCSPSKRSHGALIKYSEIIQNSRVPLNRPRTPSKNQTGLLNRDRCRHLTLSVETLPDWLTVCVWSSSTAVTLTLLFPRQSEWRHLSVETRYSRSPGKSVCILYMSHLLFVTDLLHIVCIWGYFM